MSTVIYVVLFASSWRTIVPYVNQLGLMLLFCTLLIVLVWPPVQLDIMETILIVHAILAILLASAVERCPLTAISVTQLQAMDGIIMPAIIHAQ